MEQEILVSSISSGGKHTDKTLINPFDLLLCKSRIWVTVTGSSMVNVYSYSGKLESAISIQSPTGICLSENGHREHKRDSIPDKKRSYASDSGQCNVECNDKVIFVGSMNGNVYKLVTGSTPQIYVSPGGNVMGIATLNGKLYVAIQSLSTTVNTMSGMAVNTTTNTTSVRGVIYVYNANNHPVHPVQMNQATTLVPEKRLMDTDLAIAGYQPYGLKAIGGYLYITWSPPSVTLNTMNASTSTTNTSNTSISSIMSSCKQGFGYVSVYDPECDRLVRIINRSNLSSPYGIVSPSISDYRKRYTDLAERLYIGNKGTGSISIFSSSNSRSNSKQTNCKYSYMRDVSTPYGGILVNDGLMGMDIHRKSGDIYFVAAIDNGNMGLLGIMYTSDKYNDLHSTSCSSSSSSDDFSDSCSDSRGGRWRNHDTLPY